MPNSPSRQQGIQDEGGGYINGNVTILAVTWLVNERKPEQLVFHIWVKADKSLLGLFLTWMTSNTFGKSIEKGITLVLKNATLINRWRHITTTYMSTPILYKTAIHVLLYNVHHYVHFICVLFSFHIFMIYAFKTFTLCNRPFIHESLS